MAKKRKAPAPTDASTDATASSSTADAAPTESVDDIFAALAKPSKTAKKAATKPTKCEPARRRDDDDAGDDAWRAGGGETDYYGKQRDPKVHRCVPARPPPPRRPRRPSTAGTRPRVYRSTSTSTWACSRRTAARPSAPSTASAVFNYEGGGGGASKVAGPAALPGRFLVLLLLLLRSS
jgi:hypothetical protein